MVAGRRAPEGRRPRTAARDRGAHVRAVGDGAGRGVTAADRLLRLQRTAGNASVARMLAVPVQRGEKWDQITGVGPLDAWAAKDAAQEALAHAGSSGLPGFSDGPQDAYRHALWTCLMTLSIGASQAKEVGDIHEQQVTNPDDMIQLMDNFNNSIGILLSKQAKQKSDCPGLVMGALRRGNLLIISNWRARSDARHDGKKPPPAAHTIASNVVPEDLETGIRPLEAGRLDVHAMNEKSRAEREQKIIAVLKRPVRAGDDAGGVAKHREVLALFREFSSYWWGTYRDRIKARASNDELVTLLYSRVSRFTRSEVLAILEGRERKPAARTKK
jgi:hypothetical protein